MGERTTSAWTLGGEYRFSEGVVRYGVVGDGPDVVLVHGTPWSSFTWSRLIPVLSTRYRVHFHDLIGYGQSEKRQGQDVSLEAQGRLLAELLEHWGTVRPMVVAHDFGGATSLRAHLLHGCDFDRLVLVDVVAMAPWGSPFFAHVREHEAAFAGVPAYIHEAVVRAYIDGALHAPLADDVVDALVRPWLGDAGQGGFYRQIAQADQRYTDEIEPLYPAIRCPVSILWGERDTWIPIETGRRLHRAIPGSSFTVVEGAGHLAQLESADVVNAEVARFLAAGA